MAGTTHHPINKKSRCLADNKYFVMILFYDSISSSGKVLLSNGQIV
tara:strand:- start:627 stop:764 length:138 start_codon:yes stop_codon:yes gene_type:complete